MSVAKDFDCSEAGNGGHFLGSSEGFVEVDGYKCYAVLSLGVQCYPYVRTGCGVQMSGGVKDKRIILKLS